MRFFAKANPSKIRAIAEVPIPNTQKELKAFLGLINFYESFLPNKARHVKPLYDMANAKKFM